MKREANFGILFRHWIKANPQRSASYELKQTTKNSLLFNAVKNHQLDYMTAINSDKGVLIRVQGVNGEPDYIYLRQSPAYIVIKYPDCFCIISIDTFKKERFSSEKMSLTSKRARMIADITVELKKPRS